MERPVGFNTILHKAVQHVPLLILIPLNIIWTCNLGFKFLQQTPGGDDFDMESGFGVVDSSAGGPPPPPHYPPPSKMCQENTKMAIALSLQLASFIAILLVAMFGLIATGPFEIQIRRKLLRKIEFCLLAFILPLLAASSGFYLFYALTIPDDSIFPFPMPHHTHFTTLTFMSLEIIYALLLTIVHYYFG